MSLAAPGTTPNETGSQAPVEEGSRGSGSAAESTPGTPPGSMPGSTADAAPGSTPGTAPGSNPGTADAPQSLEDRYGSGRRKSFDRRFAWAAAGLLVAAGVGYLLFSGWQDANQVSVQDIGHTVNDDGTVDVKFEVTGPPNTPVACAVEAINKTKATVGWKIVELPVTDARTHTITANVITTNPATAATARACWVVEDPSAAE